MVLINILFHDSGVSLLFLIVFNNYSSTVLNDSPLYLNNPFIKPSGSVDFPFFSDLTTISSSFILKSGERFILEFKDGC